MSMKERQRNRYVLLSLFFCMSVCLGACSQQQAVDKTVEIQQDTTYEATYEIARVTRKTVQQVMSLQCTYSQTREMELSFDLDQELITDVFVEKGDTVKRGQVLASVNVDATRERIEALQYEISVNELARRQAIETRDFELAQEKLWYEGYTTQSKDDKEAMKEACEEIEKTYEKIIQDIDDALYFQTMRLAQYQSYIEKGELKAPMDGVISQVMSDLEGSLCVKGETVMRIYAPDSKLYYSDDVEAIPYLKKDEEYTIVCGLGKSAREYTVVPENMENWGEQVYFRLLDEDYDPNHIVLGKITLVIEEKENALSVDEHAIHASKDAYYVYTLDENNVRRMQFVEIGLRGNGSVEILSGLSEGDRVIVK